MTLREYVVILRSRWYLLVLFLVVGIGCAVAWNITRTPVYTATSQMIVSTTTRGTNITALETGSNYAQSMVVSYAAIAKNADVMDAVIQDLGLNYGAGELAGKITVANPEGTVLLNVTVSDSSAEQAAAIANSVAKVFPTFVTDLSDPNGNTPSLVRIAQSNQATVPADAISPRKALNLGYGVLAGLVLGAGLVTVREQLNTSVSSVKDIEKVTGSTPLGLLPYDRQTRNNPLIETGDNGPRSEAFRSLRTNLQFANVDNPPRVIVVTSALPAEGKSTTASNIALTLALGGSSVVLVEGDLRKPSLGGYLKVGSNAGLTNILAGRASLRDVVIPHGVDGLFMLLSGPLPPNPSELLGSNQMQNLVQTLSEHFDYVIIDAPPLLPVTDGAVLATIADGAVLVVRHGKTSRENLDQAVGALKAVDARLLGTVLNFAPLKKLGPRTSAYGYSAGAPVPEVFGARLPPEPQPQPTTPADGQRARHGRLGQKVPPEGRGWN